MESAETMKYNQFLLMASIITFELALAATDSQAKKTLTIACFQPLTKSSATFLGLLTLPAGQLAIQDINARPDILPDYNLTMEIWDTKV